MAILAIETSCDETAAAVINGDGVLLSSIVRSQEKIHANYGGIVPEIASRSHCLYMLPIVEQALAVAKVEYPQLEAIAVTNGPGLLGSLLVGVSTAKALAYGLQIPLIGIDHLEAHIAAAYLGRERPDFAAGPVLAMVISGGHSAIYLLHDFGKLELIGATVDDAVGEAFDKIGAHLQLGYPGGPVIDRLAQDYQGAYIVFPMPMQNSGNLNLSFSGLKTAVVTYCKKHQPINVTQVVASFQKAAVGSLVHKLELALARHPKIKEVVVCGGVACNKGLRLALEKLPALQAKTLRIPPPIHCTDNAAMIARLGLDRFQRRQFTPLDCSPYTSYNR
jgi:N6-L-threonylcarbamoyladenine synthase